MSRSSSATRRHFLKSGIACLASLSAGRRLLADDAIKVPNVLERLQRDIDEAALSMRFKGGSADECRKWQAEFGTKLRALLGPFAPPAKWKTVVQKTTDLEDHRRE